MSDLPTNYPAPMYLGEGGELTATYRGASHSPELVYAKSGTWLLASWSRLTADIS